MYVYTHVCVCVYYVFGGIGFELDLMLHKHSTT
jgi:hypothetical protein